MCSCRMAALSETLDDIFDVSLYYITTQGALMKQTYRTYHMYVACYNDLIGFNDYIFFNL